MIGASSLTVIRAFVITRSSHDNLGLHERHVVGLHATLRRAQREPLVVEVAAHPPRGSEITVERQRGAVGRAEGGVRGRVTAVLLDDRLARDTGAREHVEPVVAARRTADGIADLLGGAGVVAHAT